MSASVRHLHRPLYLAVPLYLTVLAALLVAAPACGGGGGGGPGPGGAGQGLVLMNFDQAGQDNVPINRILSFQFSEAVDPTTIGAHSIQIREGPSFGLSASGDFVIDPDDPSSVQFRPDLLTVCGNASSAGMKPGTTYKVTFVGYPEEFAIANTKGQALEATEAFQFSTRPESDPEYLEDQLPGQAPYVLTRSPDAGSPACAVEGDDAFTEIGIEFSENLDPCSVNESSVRVSVYEFGGAHPGEEYPAGSGNYSGFVPPEDSLPDDPTSWGGNAVPLSTPQAVLCNLILDQDYEATRLRIVPQGGSLPENSLIVVSLTFGLTDFGGDPLSPERFSFTTENTPRQNGYLEIPFNDTTPIDTDNSTADLNTARSPGRAQGWMLFAGDGDNGQYDYIPSYPLFNSANYAYVGCTAQTNSGTKDDFNPGTGNHTLHTGATRVPEICTNNSDGSTAVEWEFRSFRIRNGARVTILGKNPAIIKSLGDIVIEAGGELILQGEDGEDGHSFSYYDVADDRDGGAGVAGSGDGGMGHKPNTIDSSKDGFAGYGSDDYWVYGSGLPGGNGLGQGGWGSGEGGVGAEYATTYNYSGQCGQGAGGGGHATVGQDGMSVLYSPYTWAMSPRGVGGEIYPDSGNADQMLTPSAGSGGGGGGWCWMYYTYDLTYYYYAGDGGGGGSGGGFVDLTSQGDIRVYGMIDARGGDGGNGGIGGYVGGGGGGGGSGGAVRLLTPNDIDVSGGTILTTGGRGGRGSVGNYSTGRTPNDGGDGGIGRIAMEDGDSIITGAKTATMVPALNTDGYYSGLFQPSRFTAGATTSVGGTEYMFLGPLTPPDLESLSADDFVAGIPLGANRGTMTAMVVDVQGRPMLPDGSVDSTPGAETGWYCIGYFKNGETPQEPAWTADAFPPASDVLPDYDPTAPGSDIVGAGIGNVPPCSYLQVRIWFWVPDASTGFGPQDPGPYIDDMRVPFSSDQ